MISRDAFPPAAISKAPPFWPRVGFAVRTGAGGSLFAALVVVALIAGCGGGGAKPSTSSTGGRSSGSSSTKTATSTATQPSVAAYWPYKKLVGKLAGRTVVLPRGPVRMNTALLVCNGDGAPLTTGATRRWRHYTCTQAVFRDGADHDVTFDVVISSATQLRITTPRYGPQ